MLTVSFIHHSCFAVENDSSLVVFDFSRDSDDSKLAQLIASRGDRQLYFVVSHFHEDHFSPAILDYDDARLLVSYDTAKRRRLPKERLTAVLRPGDIYEDEHLKLQAMRSTDVGISSLVTFPCGTTVYHAGDNNNWYFVENREEHIRCSLDEMEGLFISTLREIRTVTKSIDYVMFPVDPRLEGEMLRGACQWLQHIKTAHFYPMHCWERWEEVHSALAQLKELFPETKIEEL